LPKGCQDPMRNARTRQAAPCACLSRLLKDRFEGAQPVFGVAYPLPESRERFVERFKRSAIFIAPPERFSTAC
jgi:hypothetical protein